jgi:hypothetical protein
MDDDINTSQQIPTHQFGFRENHSNTQQCHRIVNEILESLEEKQLCTAAFLDIHSIEYGMTAFFTNSKLLFPHPITSC